MAIVSGPDISFNKFGNELNCLYYYCLNENMGTDISILGYASTIQTVCYNPFIEIEDLPITCSQFDVERYGQPNDSTRVPSVYRINGNVDIQKKLFKKTLTHNISNEPILNFYPYRYLMLYDGFNQPLIIKPQYLPQGKELDLRVRTNVNQNSKYVLFPYAYKNDGIGNLEGIVNDIPMMSPVSSSAYSQFWATSSASFEQSFINNSIENQTSYKHNVQNLQLQKEQTMVTNGIGMTSNVISGLASAFTGNIGGAVNSLGGIVNSGVNMYYGNKNYNLSKNQADEIKANSEYFNEANKMATIQDYMKTPRAVSSLGTDMSFNKLKNNNSIILYDVTLKPEVIAKLEKFYHKFGYPLNKYVDDFKYGQIRENFNFIKMGYCDVFGEKIPKDDLDIIRTVFESGVTFWNVDNGIRIGDYSVTNNERS